jgi:proline dehydrogenase
LRNLIFNFEKLELFEKFELLTSKINQSLKVETFIFRVPTGHGRPGKSQKVRIFESRSQKSQKVAKSHRFSLEKIKKRFEKKMRTVQILTTCEHFFDFHRVGEHCKPNPLIDRLCLNGSKCWQRNGLGLTRLRKLSYTDLQTRHCRL